MSARLSGSKSGRFLLSVMRRFASARSGNVAVVTALMMVPMMGVASLAVDYAYAVKGQGKLDQIALIAATNAANSTRDILNAAGSGSNSLDSSATAEGKLVAETFFDVQTPSITNTSVIARTVTVTRTGNAIKADVTYRATITTLIARAIGVTTVTINGGGSMIVGLMDLPQSLGATAMVIDEKWGLPAGTSPQLANPNLPIINDWFSGTTGTASPLTGPPIVRSSGVTSTAPTLRVGNPDGSIPPVVSKKVYLEKGFYELRYWYKSTVIYPEYEPVYICGTVETEMNWVTSWYVKINGVTDYSYKNTQTARAGVYLNAIVGNPQTSSIPKLSDFRPPPTRQTPDRTAGSPYVYHSRVDICAYSSRWIQRSVNIEISQTGYFWLNFVSEPALSSAGTTRNGFYLGPVQLCKGAQAAVQAATACPDALNNNWPWAAGTTLYEDTFDEAPAVNTTAGLNAFSKTRSIFTRASGYDKVPDWVRDRTGGTEANMAADSFIYTTAPAGSVSAGGWGGGNIVSSTRLGVSLYRRMLLMPGTYSFKFAVSSDQANPPKRWCPMVLGQASTGYQYVDSATPNCSCAAGNVTTEIVTDEWIKPFYIDPSDSNGNPVKSSPAFYKAPGDGLSALSDCHSGNSDTRNSGEVYCVLIPRTQFYGLRVTFKGPYLDTTVGTIYAPYTSNVMLDSGAPFLDHIRVQTLTMGVKNKFTGTVGDPGDFENFSTNCPDPRPERASPSRLNIIDGGVPVWPGYSTVSLNRLKVTASRF